MRKIVVLFATFLLFLITSSCTQSKPSTPVASELETTGKTSATDTYKQESTSQAGKRQEMVYKMASYALGATDFKTLVSITEAVVRVTVLEGADEIRANQPDLSKGITPSSHINTPVKIEEIFKTNGKLAIGQTVTIEEYYATAPSSSDPDVTVVFTQGIMMPLKVGEQYILFLHDAQFEADYRINQSFLGKYPYNEKTKNLNAIKSLSREDLEIVPIKEIPIPQCFYDIAEEVMRNYSHQD
jgi:hypothetical protein